MKTVVVLLAILIAIIVFAPAYSAEGGNGAYLFGGVGIGRYSQDMGAPEITTPNPIGQVTAGLGYSFPHNFDGRLQFEHWSSLEGFPRFWDSPNEHGDGFNALWLKLEKRLYF